MKGSTDSPCESIEVGVWHKVLHSEDCVLEALDDFSQAILEFLFIWAEQQLIWLQDKLRGEEWRKLGALLILKYTSGSTCIETRKEAQEMDDILYPLPYHW